MKLTSNRTVLYLAFAISIVASQCLCGQLVFEKGSEVRYLKGSEAGTLPADWTSGTYDDSNWSSGPMPLRYGDGYGGTVLDDMQYNYSTVYIRSTFLVENLDTLVDVNLYANYDDGFVIWINGEEAYRQNAPDFISPDAVASIEHESGEYEHLIVELEDVNLVEGENTLAIVALNVHLTVSTDFHFDLGMDAGFREPVHLDTIGLTFSRPSGFYDASFFLDIEAGDPSWNVVYTLDGSNPQDSETAVEVGNKASVHINPSSSSRRPVTPAVVLRASSKMPGIRAAFPESRTYIFLDDVMEQSYPGGGWPDYNVNGQWIDLDMDTDVTKSAQYQGQMEEAMTDIPSLSVITDLSHLFDPEEGIYVNAWGHGMEWERECSVELVNPDGSDGFNVNAGLRIRGGWSRHNDFPKHSFRLFFRSDYGDPKLNYPLFEDEGVDRYDKIDLRTSQNHAWTKGSHRNTMLREVFSRDLQGDMGQPYTRSRYYHLYLNGMYWGLFQTQERSEARFAADYLGGSTDDYDVIKVDTDGWGLNIEATDGNLDLWEDLWDMCQEGFSGNEEYFFLEGKDMDGERMTNGQVLVDIDNLIDYMMIVFYTGSYDAPTSSFRQNRSPNNFYAIKNRENPAQGFTFYAHDMEHGMFAEVVSPGKGIQEDRVNLHLDGMYVDNFNDFHPQWLHHKLTENAEYRLRFADRTWRYLQPGGLLTEEKNLERLMYRYEQIDMAIIGASARWGDTRSTVPFTKEDWNAEVDRWKNEWITQRNDILISQLEYAGLYGEMIPPEVSMDGEVLAGGLYQVQGPYEVTLKNKNGIGVTYYTLDGSDPRLPGGAPSQDALSDNASSFNLQLSASTRIRARTEAGGSWSPIREFSFAAAQMDYSNLAITELHYHPLDMVLQGDTISGKDFEFLEFKNIGTETINLSGLVLDSAIYYEFPEGELLPPGQFYVIASKPSDFYRRYGLVASGNSSKNLSNGGEEILLEDSLGTPIIHFAYSDDPPWPVEADGDGNSLVSKEWNPTGNPADYNYWKVSHYIGGSPFQDDPLPNWAGNTHMDEAEIVLYPNPTTGQFRIRWPDGIVPDHAGIQIFGMNGQLVFQDAEMGAGAIELDALGIGKGVYMVKITTPAQVFRKKVVYR